MILTEFPALPFLYMRNETFMDFAGILLYTWEEKIRPARRLQTR